MKAKEMVQNAISTQASVEQAFKKLEWESKEREESLTRQIAKLTEEVGFLRAKQAASFEVNESKEASILRSTLATLETRFREVKELYNTQKRELDEASFECETLKTTVDRLKNECQDSSDRETNERKQRHALEMTLIELKKKVAEATVAQKETEEAFKQSINEIGVMRGELTQQGEAHKAEKRKALALDRELEQSKFLAERREKEHKDSIEILTIQVKNYKSEIESLNSRVELLSKELQVKNSKDNKESSTLTIKVRELETREASLLVTMEDLQKKLTFYKDKALKRDYNSVSKNSILEKLASVVHFVASIRETWETEKFIIKQEMSCMATLLAQTSDIYFHNLKPKQLRRHIEQNITSKIFARFSSDQENGLTTCTFGTGGALYSDRKEPLDYKDQMFKRLEEEMMTLSSKITPKKQLAIEKQEVKKVNSPTKPKEERRPLTDLNNYANNLNWLHMDSIQQSERSKVKDTNLNFNTFEVKEIPSSNRELQKESTASFIARINARVLEKSHGDSTTQTVKTPVKLPGFLKENIENIKPNLINTFSMSINSNKDSKPTIADEKMDYKKIEKETQEIEKRIQALKKKDFSLLNK